MKITIYTITDCQFSKQEKEYLTSHNLPYEEKNLETNHEYLTEMLNVSNNFAGTPVTKLEKDDGNIIVLKGFTAEEFDKELGFKKEEAKETKPEAVNQPPKEAPVQSAPPTEPPTPMPPVPQPPAPTPVPQPPVTPPAPQIPSMPPTVQEQPMPVNQNQFGQSQPPQAPTAQPQQPVVETTNSVDDASLDAILSQLQEKTGENNNGAANQNTANPNSPSIPDFGNNG